METPKTLLSRPAEDLHFISNFMLRENSKMQSAYSLNEKVKSEEQLWRPTSQGCLGSAPF